MSKGTTMDTERRSKLANLFNRMQSASAEKSFRDAYSTDDVIAVLILMARGYSISDIVRATFISRDQVSKWRDAMMGGTIEYLYPDIRDRLESFDENSVPRIQQRDTRKRIMFAWRQQQLLLAEGRNPYDPIRPIQEATEPDAD
jgi:hypothetical protein